MIKTQNLTKSFKDKIAVDSINIEAKAGQIVGLLGENGAGKTTALRMLATMLKPTEGDAFINGYSVIKDHYKVRKEIGILFGGEVGLYDRLTAKENIEYFAQLNGMDSKAMDESVEYLVKKFEMQEYINKRVGTFSRGMKQRVAISRSIVHKPTVMLLDEPTNGLDVTASKIVQDFILESKDQGKAIIFSSHSMNEVEKLCDKIFIIHKGRIIDQGSLDYFRKKYEMDNMENIFIKLVGEDQ